MTKILNPPVQNFHDGFLIATIWKKGNFYSVEFTRGYVDQKGKYHVSHSFSGSEPLRLARLAEKAYDRIIELGQHIGDNDEAEPNAGAG